MLLELHLVELLILPDTLDQEDVYDDDEFIIHLLFVDIGMLLHHWCMGCTWWRFLSLLKIMLKLEDMYTKDVMLLISSMACDTFGFHICCWHMEIICICWKRLICIWCLLIITFPIWGERMMTLMILGQGDELLTKLYCTNLCFYYSFLVMLRRISYFIIGW